MHRVRPVEDGDIRELAAWLGVEFAAGEAEEAADRLNNLLDIYETLEDIPRPGTGDSAPEQFSQSRPGEGDDPYNAWLQRFDLSREAGGALDGTTVAVKDNMCVRGVEMTVGSRAFEGFVPGRHARVVDRLLERGATVVGKTNMDELAFAPTGDTSAFGPTLNPVDTDHVPGGSSCGSAAAVADGQVDFALGSDTGGSVRIPASYCGIVGIKPTFGLVPAHGVVGLAESLDHVGVISDDVATAARGLAAIADTPPGRTDPVVDTAAIGADPGDVAVGVAEGFFETHVSGEVERAVRAGLDAFADRGVTVETVDIPALAHSRPAWWGIAPAEFAAMYLTAGAGLWRHERVDPSLAAGMARVRGAAGRTFGQNIKEMLALGAYLIRTEQCDHYVRGQNLRAQLKREIDAVLADVDVLATPTTPTTALEINEFERGVTPPVNWDCHPLNLTGHPAISVPAGTAEGMPVGLQFVGNWYDEQTVFDVADAYVS
ncbi:MAG: amidase [Halovenus sp.]